MGRILNPFWGRYVTSAYDYGGSTHFTRGTDLTGVSNGKTGTFNGWFRRDGLSNAIIMNNLVSGSGLLDISFDASNRLRLQGQSSSGSNSFFRVTNATYTVDGLWHHLLVSWDTNTATVHVFVDDTAIVSFASNLNANSEIEYVSGNWGIAGTPPGGSKFNGCLSELFFHTTFLDISVEANRRKFRTAAGKPAFLGTNGSLPLGVQPAIYDKFGNGTNLGTGGSFSVSGSAPTLCSTSPSDP